MIRDIVVHIPVDAPAHPAVSCASSVAALFGAHLDGIVCAYQPINSSIVVGASAAYYALPTEYNTDLEAAAARISDFSATAHSLGISHGSRTIRDTPACANATLAEISRLYDLCVVAQTDPDIRSYYNLVPEAVLFRSGRPMLLVPYIHSGAFTPGRVLICWDGEQPSARAVHDAMPFLRRADTIDVLAVNEQDDGSEGASSTGLIAHLLRHGLRATRHRLTAEPASIHNIILSLAADRGTELIVMGGYGHSRLSEFILGGVTRGMLASLTVPALISH